MADTTEVSSTPQKSHPQEDKAGDILRKERITRRITIETIAKDLKLNVAYIKSLESNKYEELPAAPYVRVYLRSIAQYLMLDPDEILKRYLKERGGESESFQTEHDKKIKVDSPTQGRSPLPWIIIGISILGLAILSYFSSNRTALTKPKPPTQTTDNPVDSSDTALQQTIVPTDTLSDSTRATLLDGNTGDTMQGAPTAATPQTDSIKLVLQAIRDSVWVQAYSDGNSWKSSLKQVKTLKARDSINLYVGINQNVKYTLNGKVEKIIGSGIVVLKVDRTGIHARTIAEWKAAFSGR
jgi:cytoskeletal protein RodZ